MPAGAVIRRPQALSGITGRKERVAGDVSPVLNLEAQPRGRIGNGITRAGERQAERAV